MPTSVQASSTKRILVTAERSLFLKSYHIILIKRWKYSKPGGRIFQSFIFPVVHLKLLILAIFELNLNQDDEDYNKKESITR